MADPRIKTFASTICNALDIVADDIVLIWSHEGAIPLVVELQKQIMLRSAYPEIRVNFEQVRYFFWKYSEKKHLRRFPPGLAREIELSTKVISIESITNPCGLTKIDQGKLQLWQHTVEPHHRKLDFLPTVVTIFPNAHYANKAGMCLEEYEELFYNAVAVDLEQLHRQYSATEQMLSLGNKFEICTSNSYLSFYLGERNFTMNSLLVNLPDGEIYCAPLENSVHGHIRFEQPASFHGKVFENLYLEFREGRVVQYDCDTEKNEFGKILSSDEGACRLGEFGIGINPAIPDLTNDILFDEKVAGTFHLALGDSRLEAGGTNRSVIHFEMVKNMRHDGEIKMDDHVVYREGNFCS